MRKDYDFSGWASRNDLKCSDGRTIRRDAFKDCDGLTVPLVWNHQHGGMENVLGHALLVNRPEGVYTYGYFNDTERGLAAKSQVLHGDITSLSIYANQLKQSGGDVIHGAIREVSLVLAGANPGAFIDSVIEHGDESDEEAIIYTGDSLSLAHADDEEDEEEGKVNTDNKEKADSKAKTVKDVMETLNEEQKQLLYAMVGAALEEGSKEDTDDSEGGKDMKHNLFDTEHENDEILTHADEELIIQDGKRYGSLRDSFMAHAADYGIENIDWLMPEFQNVNGNGAPDFIRRTPDAWINAVMTGVHHTPFSRIKMMFADLREDEARAKGYLKGNLKKEEVFGLLKRTIEPTTIYKKQKLDRDDIVDITDFDVVAWLKGEMRMMLDEEIARAILFGDGRSALSEDKISPTNIIPICADAALYTIQKTVTPGQNEELGHAIINAAVKAQDDYEGSGNLTCFIAASTVSDMLLLEDKDGHRMYKGLDELALAMGVNKIVKVPASIIPAGIYAVVVDLKDYNVGADKGGSVNMFDDFDIDYNQQKYLIETRCSGGLTRPFAAIVLKSA